MKTAMTELGPELPGAVADHGGSLGRVRARFPDAPEPWIDLSTGINPHSYPHSAVAATAFTRLPEPADEERLRDAAALAYRAPAAANVAAAPGTQILLPMLYGLMKAGNAAVFSPTYAEHGRAAKLAGHRVVEVADLGALADADLAIVVNPNNPDGRLHRRGELADVARRLADRGGILVVDEAFMDVSEADASLCPLVDEIPVVVLRSFGKFYGLAGVRLGFAISSRHLAERLVARLGPWAVSGPALSIGIAALRDDDWRAAMRRQLHTESRRLDDLIRKAELSPCGGTDLFRFVRDPKAAEIHDALGRAGIAVRIFDALPGALRFGLPDNETAWQRLEQALSGWTRAREW